MEVGFGLEVERSGAKDGGVKPGPGFGRSDGASVEVAGGSGPAGGGKAAPGGAFAFGEIDERVARKRHGRGPVGLGAEEGAVLVGPLADGREVIVVGELGEGTAPIVADGGGVFGGVGGKGGQVGQEIVTAALAEFVEEVGGPIGAFVFERVAEDGVGRILAEGLGEAVADGLEVVRNGGA